MSFRPATTAERGGSSSTTTGGSSIGDRTIIAIGSNLGSPAGSPAETVRMACRRLGSLSTVPVVASSLYETSPLECPEGSARFTNAVVIIQPLPGMTAINLLDALQALEHEFGRDRTGGINAPRTLDLDLIAFGDETQVSPRLQLPHPRAHERGFVLVPLAELLPDLHLPGQSCSVAEQLQALPRRGQCGGCPDKFYSDQFFILVALKTESPVYTAEGDCDTGREPLDNSKNAG